MLLITVSLTKKVLAEVVAVKVGNVGKVKVIAVAISSRSFVVTIVESCGLGKNCIDPFEIIELVANVSKSRSLPAST